MVSVRKARKINFKYNFKVYWSFLKRYKGPFLLVMLLILIGSITHLADKFLFKIIVDNGTSYISNTLARDEFAEILVVVALVYVVIMVIRTVSKWLQIHVMNHLDANLIIDLKQRFFNHVVHLSHNFHTTHKTGSLISRITRGAGAMERMTDFLVFNTLPLVFQMMLVGASIIYFDLVTAIVVAITAVVFVSFSLYIQQIQRKANIGYNNKEDIEKANISDIFTNIDSVKYFGKEAAIKKSYSNLSNKTRKAALRHWGYFRWFDAGHSFILALGTMLLIWVPIIRLLNGDITIGTVVFIYTAYTTLFGPLFGFVHGMRGFYTSMADFESLFQYARFKNEIKDRKNAEELKIQNGEVEFKNVTFNYGKRKLLKGFSLKIKPGEKVAFVGHSGSGKTTLVKLLYRLYEVNSGKILIDGKDIRKFKQESLRSELSIVPQEAILFDESIYNNIAFSDQKTSREQIMAAMKFAQLDKFVANLPKKEKTIVGERGVRLSGGEKQRVSIARAILADKKILVLDEATSSLDSQTENDIQEDLHNLMKGRTSIIVAHRLSTIMSADKIVVLDNGRISQIGSHKELVKKQGIYKKLWNLQKGGFIE